jgi:hypothetical protein
MGIFDHIREFVRADYILFAFRLHSCGIVIGDEGAVIPQTPADFLNVCKRFIIHRPDKMEWTRQEFDERQITEIKLFGHILFEQFHFSKTRLRPEFRVRISNPIIRPSSEVPSADTNQLFDMVEEVLSEALELDPEPEREPLPVKLPNRSPNPRAVPPTLAQRVVDLRAKVMRTQKQGKLLTQELARKDRLRENRLSPIAVPPPPSTGHSDRVDLSLTSDVIQQLFRLSSTNPNGGRFSDAMIDLAFALSALNGRADRVLRGVLAFPSPPTLLNHLAREKERIWRALRENPDRKPLLDSLREYQDREKMPAGWMSWTLAFDGLPVTAAGLQGQPHRAGSCFSFVMLPLDHRYPELLVQSIIRAHGKMNVSIFTVTNESCEVLMESGFHVHFVRTDGDGAMDPEHTQAFLKCARQAPRLESIVAGLTSDRHTMTKWLISDLLP